MLGNAFVSAATNLVILVVIPFGVYAAVQRLRNRTGLRELTERVGLRMGERYYLILSAGFSLLVIAALLIWPPDMEAFVREGSAWRKYDGLGLTPLSIAMALIYGVVQTDFAEEFFFRGMIAGSLSRRLPLRWANLIQALIFLAPHLILLRIMPEMWPTLVVIFAGSLFAGWIRIKSGSMVGPWLIHAAVNVVMGLSVAFRTVG